VIDQKTVLFLCTGNACRSQMAEAMLRHVGGDRFTAHSAGSAPAGFVHPLALAALDQLGISNDSLESKGWDQFRDTRIDVAITLCDSAAQQPCPTFPGRGIRAHWPLPDPSFYPGSPDEQFEFCMVVARRLLLKIECLATLDFDRLSPADLQRELDALAA
jgi:arsenate reductase